MDDNQVHSKKSIAATDLNKDQGSSSQSDSSSSSESAYSSSSDSSSRSLSSSSGSHTSASSSASSEGRSASPQPQGASSAGAPKQVPAQSTQAATPENVEKAEKECEEYDFSEESESSSSSSPALSEESEDEGSEFYKPGGYHPTHIGEIYNGRYRVICKLGWGHYSTVWKVFDMADKKIRAMKIVKSSKNYTRAALDEIKILRAITMNDPHDRKFCTHLIDSFKHSGPNGIHVCMVFEVLGSNLLDLIKFQDYHGLDIIAVKFISYQIIYALNYMHSVCGLIHTDLKPENVLLYNKISTRVYGGPGSKGSHRADPSQAMLRPEKPRYRHFPPLIRNGIDLNLYRVKLVDFGNANWVEKHFTDNIQTRQYRCPEIILGNRWGPTVDMWSMACMVFELLTGDFLFRPRSSDSFTKEDDHLAQIIELLGEIPPRIVETGRYSAKYFTPDGRLANISQEEMRPQGLRETLIQKYKFDETDAREAANFMLDMLIYDPLKRKSAADMLKHPWLKEVADIFEVGSPYSLRPLSAEKREGKREKTGVQQQQQMPQSQITHIGK